MKKIFIFCFVALTLLAMACSKQTPESPVNPDEPDPYKDEFVTCNCSPTNGKASADEYLRAEINGKFICADVNKGFNDTFPNMLVHGYIKRDTGLQYYDNLYMIRFTQDGKFMMAIFLENSHALTKKYPYLLPRPNSEFCEIGEFQLINQEHITSNSCGFCSWSNWDYIGMFFDNRLKLTVDKFENGYFEGHFAGYISTGSGRVATVKNGSFRIKLVIYQKISHFKNSFVIDSA